MLLIIEYWMITIMLIISTAYYFVWLFLLLSYKAAAERRAPSHGRDARAEPGAAALPITLNYL